MAPDFGYAQAASHRRVPVRCGAVRDRRAARLGELVPLHALPAAHRDAASVQARIAPGSFRILGGDAPCVHAGGRSGPKVFCGECGSALWSRSADDPDDPERPARRVRRRSWDPARVPPVCRLRGAWEPIPGRRAAALSRAQARVDGPRAVSG